MRVEASEPEIAFGWGDEEGRCLMDCIKAIKMQMCTTDNEKYSWSERKLIEDVDVVNLSMSDYDAKFCNCL
jgi:hypothetical protein